MMQNVRVYLQGDKQAHRLGISCSRGSYHRSKKSERRRRRKICVYIVSPYSLRLTLQLRYKTVKLPFSGTLYQSLTFLSNANCRYIYHTSFSSNRKPVTDPIQLTDTHTDKNTANVCNAGRKKKSYMPKVY